MKGNNCSLSLTSSECPLNKSLKTRKGSNFSLSSRTMLCQHPSKFWLTSKKKRGWNTSWISWEKCQTPHSSTSSEDVSSGIPRRGFHLMKVFSMNGSSRAYLQTLFFIILTTIPIHAVIITRQVRLSSILMPKRQIVVALRNLRAILWNVNNLLGDQTSKTMETTINLLAIWKDRTGTSMVKISNSWRTSPTWKKKESPWGQTADRADNRDKVRMAWLRIKLYPHRRDLKEVKPLSNLVVISIRRKRTNRPISSTQGVLTENLGSIKALLSREPMEVNNSSEIPNKISPKSKVWCNFQVQT